MKRAWWICAVCCCACGGPLEPPASMAPHLSGPSYQELRLVPDACDLLGPGHGATVRVLGLRQGRLEEVDPAQLEVSVRGSAVRLQADRLRALEPGEAQLELHAGGAAAALPVSVGEAPPPFASDILEQQRGPGDGFGRDQLPGIVLGPPRGGGRNQGSLDVLSLGRGGAITVSWAPLLLYDGPGVDALVFENPFLVGAGGLSFAEPGRVAMGGEDGTWARFACEEHAFPYAGCAGVHPVLAGAPGSDVDPGDPQRAGGDGFDLALAGGSTRSFDRLRVEDLGQEEGSAPNAGFDLDAVALLHLLPADARALVFADCNSQGRLAEPSACTTTLRLGAGEELPLPRVDLIRGSGETQRGLAVSLEVQPPALAQVQGPLLRGLSPGRGKLQARAAQLRVSIDIEVLP